MRARVLAPPTRRRLASGVCVRFLSNGVPRPSHPLAHLINEIERFSPSCDVSEALTAPSSWYTDTEFLELEKLSVFHDAWLHVGHIGQVRTPGQFFSGNVVGEPFIVVRGENDLLHAHFNVCAHHAMPVAPASGTLDLTCRRGGSEFVCPYHGWRYKCDGRLRQATQVKGIKNFRERPSTLIVRAHTNATNDLTLTPSVHLFQESKTTGLHLFTSTPSVSSSLSTSHQLHWRVNRRPSRSQIGVARLLRP